MTSGRLQRLRGTHDIVGESALHFEKIETLARQVFTRFGFEELRTPILEEKELFSRALGTETDVVQKEMYEFVDRSKTSVAMRPEGTAGVVRAYLENGFDKSQGFAKFFYMGPMFRSERPQAGRLRQFHQIGLEHLGVTSPYADAEAIHALTVFLDEAGAGGFSLKLNNLGTFEERHEFRKKLHDFFLPRKKDLCEDCASRLDRNVFRILDCKVESCRKIVLQSPPLHNFLTPESKDHHKKVCDALTLAHVFFTEDLYMVRGLDYYTRTVFELTHPKLGAQDALAAGGRYDQLISSFGGDPAGAVGFAVGVERLLMCLDADTKDEQLKPPLFFIVTLGPEAFTEGFKLMSALRAHHVKVQMDLAPTSMKSQMRQADKIQSDFTLILGENELKSQKVALKNMKIGSQEELPLSEIVELLKKRSIR